VCDLETSRMGAPYIYIYIYIYMTLVAQGLMQRTCYVQVTRKVDT